MPMTGYLQNVTIALGTAFVFWALLIGGVRYKPQKFRHSFWLIITLFVTAAAVVIVAGPLASWFAVLFAVGILLALLLTPVLLIANGIGMLRREGISFPHMLSLLLGLFIGAGETAGIVLVVSAYWKDWPNGVYLLLLFILATAFYFSCLVLAFVLYVLLIRLMPHKPKYDYVIIHGCGLIGGNRVSKLLASRLDKAVALYEKCAVKPVLIPSGGKGSDETVSEAAAMHAYLTGHGIPDDHIIEEDRSETTLANLRNSKEIIDNLAFTEGKPLTPAKKPRIALVTSSYHVYRCLTYASKIGLHCTGFGAKVAGYFWPSAVIREFVAVFRQRKFLFMTLLAYFFLVICPMLLLLTLI